MMGVYTLFSKICNELKIAGKYISKENILGSSPIYLFSVNKESNIIQIDELKKLLLSFEENEIFLSDSDDVIVLYPDYGITENGMTSIPGLYDDCGNFKNTIEQWMVYLNIKCSISQGIVYLCPDCIDVILSEPLWFKKLMRQIRHYKEKFLFIIGTDENHIEDIYRIMKKEIFCRKITVTPTKKTVYIQMMESIFLKSCIAISTDVNTLFSNIIDKYYDEIDTCVIELWLKNVIWNFISNEKSDFSFETDDLDEEILKQFINPQGEVNKLGFTQ